MGIIGLILVLLFGGGGDGGLGGFSLDNGGLSAGGTAFDTSVDATTFDTNQEEFINTVVVDLENFWDTTSQEFGLQYNDATFTFYDTPTRSGCGTATAQIGPHYCPVDKGIYLELGFFDLLSRQFGAPGDAAQAYVIAHEFAHHVQNELGISTEVRTQQARVSTSDRNALSVALELQADCLAGVWMGSFTERATGLELERGDLEEALGAAAAVGDDRIQQASTGRIEPHKWTHGSSEQRQNWFYRGYDSIDTEQCDTFG